MDIHAVLELLLVVIASIGLGRSIRDKHKKITAQSTKLAVIFY